MDHDLVLRLTYGARDARIVAADLESGSAKRLYAADSVADFVARDVSSVFLGEDEAAKLKAIIIDALRRYADDCEARVKAHMAQGGA